MLQASIQPHEITALMCERTDAILRLKAVNFDLNWLRTFSVPQIISCCERMAEYLPGPESYMQELQRELIGNPEFALMLSRLISASASANEGEVKTPLCRSTLESRLSGLLEVCRANGRTVTGYAAADVLAVLEQDGLSADNRLTCLENFPSVALSGEEGARLTANLGICVAVPLVLTEPQRALLSEPFVCGCHLFSTEPFGPVSELFGFCPELAEIVRLLYQNDVAEGLTLRDYRFFAEDAPEYHRLLALVVQRLGPEASAAFLRHWQKNDCVLSELHRIEGRTRTPAGREWNEVLSTYSGYVDLLYGSRFKTISLSGLTARQEDLLTYAIVHNKKHFIRLVDEHGALFFALPSTSILFCEALYQKHFNLNELTAKDLADCAGMTVKSRSSRLLTGDRVYTFAELRLLYEASQPYVALYSGLKSDSLDYRLRVLRQLLKRDALAGITAEEDLTALAARLDQKPLYDWRQKDFGHIEGLRADDTARLLVHLDKLARLLPGIKTRDDAMLALRSLEHLDRFSSMDELKAGLFDSDPDWLVLADKMGLTPEFKTRYRDSIIAFLCRDGAGIARTYWESLDHQRHGAFTRVVKAELMGQFGTLKYFDGDLERELGCPVPPRVKAEWPKNGSVTGSGLDITERDDFFSTILLGTRPYPTCLRYNGGAYCGCLLACFDSNKKVLYAERNGRIVGRACIRLTKSRLQGTDGNSEHTAPKFSFVDLEDIAGARSREQTDEWVTLFLERPYISGAGPEEQAGIQAMLVEFARQKAEKLGTMLVLSREYGAVKPRGFAQTRLSVYISESKAGAQYLDSLGGQATVSDQGSYAENSFLVDRSFADSVRREGKEQAIA